MARCKGPASELSNPRGRGRPHSPALPATGEYAGSIYQDHNTDAANRIASLQYDTGDGVVQNSTFFHDKAGNTIVEAISLALDSRSLATDFGHQGLLEDRDTGLTHNRGRELNPDLGRFLQNDPNGLGLLMSSALAMNAQSRNVFSGLSLRSQYGDGMNLYGYVRNNPITGSDPGGTVSIWDEDIDDAAAEYYGARVATQIEVTESLSCSGG